MKKLFALLLCLVMSVMLLASCGGESKSPKELVEEAFTSLEALDAYELDMAITIDVAVDMASTSVTQSIPMVIKMAAKDLKTATPKVLMDMTVTAEGETESAIAYIEGDWIYMSMEDEGYKVPLSEIDDMGAMADYSKQLEDLLVDLPETVFEGVEASKNENGSKTIALSLSAEQFETLFAEIASSLGESMGLLGEGADVTFKPATLSVTVKDGCVSVYELDFALDITMDMYDESMTMDFSCKYKIDVKKTSGVTVTPPTGYESFEEMPMY